MSAGPVKSQLQKRTWRKNQFLVSTDPALVPILKLIEVFDSKDLYWAKTMPVQAMQEMLDHSLTFGLYEQLRHDGESLSTSELKFIGLARCVTDFTTFVYLTDVWVDPSYQGNGLGTWLVGCVREVLESMPNVRRSLLFTGDWERSVPFYERFLGMTLIETRKGEALAIMEKKGKGHPAYGREGTGYD
ncbi:gcn5-related n-acetyltransferase [Xylaria arbuscula]|nr:gcn5-related n-acetyltransferase [Xylaria arbuscula]